MILNIFNINKTQKINKYYLKIILILLLSNNLYILYSQQVNQKSNQQTALPTSLPDLEEGYPLSFYILGGPNFISHKTKLPLIYNDLECGNYENGKSNAYYLGFGVGYDIFEKYLTVDSRIYLESLPLELTQNTSNFEVYNAAQDDYVKLLLEHKYIANVNNLGLDIGLTSQPIEFIPVFFRLSYDFAFPMSGATFTNQQKIISPQGILFRNNTRTLTLESGDLQNLIVNNGVTAAIQTRFDFIDNLQIGAELSYRIGLNSIKSDAEWKTNILRLAVMLNLDNINTSTKSKNKVAEETDEITIINETTSIEVPTVKIDKDIKITKDRFLKNPKIENISILETVVTQTFPILPYIFFDSLSSDIQSKYIKRYENSFQFDEKTLPQDNLEIYYYILDIIGSRLTKNKSTINLTALADNKEISNENERYKLAYGRANIIKTYLNQKWNIDTNRIKINIKNVKSEEQSVRDLSIENRRVEISSNDESLFEPIIHSKFIEYTTKNKIHKAEFESTKELNNFDLYISNQEKMILIDKSLYEINRNGNKYKFTMKNNQNYLSKYKPFINYYNESEFIIVAENKENQLDTAQVNFSVFKEESKFELGRLNLIVFDYNSFEISNINKNMIKNFTSQAIKNNSKTRIIGSTDLIGEANYNFKLSQDRADAVGNYLKQFLKNYTFDEVKGIGPTEIKYDNSTPEGRFYCRTVMIEVKTPIDK